MPTEFPAASLWVVVVLRFVRIYGTLTFLHQGWATRAQVEVLADFSGESPSREKVGVER